MNKPKLPITDYTNTNEYEFGFYWKNEFHKVIEGFLYNGINKYTHHYQFNRFERESNIFGVFEGIRIVWEGNPYKLSDPPRYE